MRLPPYPKYKPSGIEWLGEVPEHWTVDRIKWTTTGTVNGIWGDEPNGVDDLICVRVADFDRDRFLVVDDPPTFRAIDQNQRRGRLLERGDLLIEKSGGGEKQLVGAVVYFDHDFTAVCSNFVARMPIVRGHSSRFWSYGHAALYAGRLNYPAVKQTTGIQNLDSSAYLDTPVGIPDEDEQRVIADFLDRETAKIDTLVAKKRTLIERLREKRTALISRTVTRGLPPDAARAAGLDPHPKLKPSGSDWLGDVPEHWDVKRARFVMGVNPRSERLGALRPEDEVSFVPMEAVGEYGGLNLEQTRAIADIGSGYTEFDEGDVVVAKITPCFENGKGALAAGLVNGTAFGTTELHVLRPASTLERRFLFYFTISKLFRSTGEGEMYGAGGQKRVPPEFCENVRLPLPLDDEQRAIADFLDRETARIDGMVAKVDTAIERLQEYRTAFITAAVTGKIDVRGAVE
jgi:type I restriction enzyme, S subunit